MSTTEATFCARLELRDQLKPPTPVPSGLQDFPPLAAPQPRHVPSTRLITSTQAASSTIKPVVPVVPAPFTRTASTVKDKQLTQEISQSQEKTISGSGTPEPTEPAMEIFSSVKPPTKETPFDKPRSSGSAPDEEPGSSKDTLIPPVPSGKAGKASDKRQAPGRIDVAAAKEMKSVDGGRAKTSTKPQKSGETSATSQQSASTLQIESQPDTPTKTLGQTTSTSGARPAQPRTLKVVPIARAENVSKVASASPTTADTPVVNKASSRRPSLASIHPPGTPISEKISDNASLTSTSISRANSPPPSKVGTAPVRHVSKSQQKKERQARAKQAEDVAKSEATIVLPVTEEPEIAPIIGRKKKTKKNRDTRDSTTAFARPISPVVTDGITEKKEPSQPTTPPRAPKDEMKKDAPKAEPPREPESPATPDVPISNIEPSKASFTAASLLASLQKAGDFHPNVHDLFKGVPGLNQRYDVPSNEYPQSPSIPPLTEAQRALLDQGTPICIEVGHNKHTVVLPDHTTLSHMSKEQAQRYIALHRSVSLTPDQNFFNASRQESGRPQLHPPRQMSTPSEDGKTLVNRFAAPPALEQVSRGRPALPTMYPTDDRLGPQRPIMEVDDAERALMASKKETEALEKKLNALMRKNRRMMFGGHS